VEVAMNVRITYLTDGEIKARNELRMQQLANEANYATVLGLFLGGLAEEPDREEYGLSEADHTRILAQVA
jgi:hypothetical protein